MAESGRRSFMPHSSGLCDPAKAADRPPPMEQIMKRQTLISGLIATGALLFLSGCAYEGYDRGYYGAEDYRGRGYYGDVGYYYDQGYYNPYYYGYYGPSYYG